MKTFLKTVAIGLLALLWAAHIASFSCAPAQETTTTTWITYTQYEVVGKATYFDDAFGDDTVYMLDVRVNNKKVENWKNKLELYYQYEVGDFFYEKRIHELGIDSKEFFLGKAPQ